MNKFNIANSNLGFADDDDDDLYGGFNYSIDLAPPQTGNRLNSGYGGQNPQTSSYRAPPSQMGRQAPQSRLGTAQGGEARPMTSVAGAGFSSNPRTANGQRVFDPLGEGKKGPAPPLAEKSENSPEDNAKEMERKVNELLEKSANETVQKNFLEALDLAKEAGKKERQLCKFREGNGLSDQINLDLTYSICFNLANCYHLNEMYNEAISTYTLIVKNKQYPQAGLLRVNMGNIYYEQEKYPSAIKMYRMALDQIPNTGKELRYKIMRNIGNAFVRLGQFQDAIQSYEEIMESNPDFRTGFNLIICYYALGDGDKLRRGFTNLLNITIDGAVDEDDEEEIKAVEHEAKSELQPDGLREELRIRQKQAKYYIMTAAKMCAPVLDRQKWIVGYDWIIETLKPEHESIANEMEICKAMHYLKEKEFDQAIEVLKSFEKKDQKLKAMASTNLSFLYFVEGDWNQADKYANLAVRHQRYNAKALVNKGNCLYVKQDYERAKELYLEAIGVEADCIEAIYNLGLVNQRIGVFNEALQAFEKLHSILPTNTEVLYQIANLHDIMGNCRQAAKWFNILITCFGTSNHIADPGVLTRLGQIFNKDDDETQAFHFHLESYRYFPVNLDVISWLGVWYVKSELYEKAIQFFERASQIQPHEVKWRLMVTSCYRRMGNYQKALDLYEEIHHEYPENLECLRYLVAICKDLGQKYDQYQQKLAKLERNQPTNTSKINNSMMDTSISRKETSENNAPHHTTSKDTRQVQQRSPEYAEMNGNETTSLVGVPKPIVNTNISNKKQMEVDQSDDWGDADVGDLLGD